MISFKEYLILNEEVSPLISKHGDYEHNFNHNNTPVKVLYSNDGKKTYDVDFQIDKGWGRGKNRTSEQKKEGYKILHKIGAHVEDFIKSRRPKILKLNGNTPKKNRAYEAVARHMAKKYGGQYTPPEDMDNDPHEIVFPHH